MNQDVFCFDIHNQLSSELFFENSEIFKDNNYYDLLNNIKSQSSQINFCSFNNFYFSNSIINIRNEKTEIDKEKEKQTDIKLIFNSNNINTNIINNNTYNSNNIIEKNQELNNTPLNKNNNKRLYDDFLLNYENNSFNFKVNNNMKLINENNKTNILFNNNKNKNEPSINIDFDNNINKKELENKIIDEEAKNNNYNNDEFSLVKQNIKNFINFIGKRKRRINKKRKSIIENQIIKYGHPKALIYKTMKQKLNIHKKLDLECRNDTILLIYSISKLKNILKNVLSKKNVNDKNRIQNLYRNSILYLQHREYAQDITGYNLI